MADTRYAIGLDLHGTLLDRSWRIREDLTGELIEAFAGLKERCTLYICSGNDLTFISSHLPAKVVEVFDGYVLETGCVLSDGRSEEVIVPEETASELRGLESRLREQPFEDLEYFARRLATVSLFTRTEEGGTDPARLFGEVSRFVEDNGFGGRVYVTHSDVAVDVIPAGHNKFTGLRSAAEAPGLIGIADSFNDLHLIADSDLAFLPSNASLNLVCALEGTGRSITEMEAAGGIESGSIYRSSRGYTEAVVDILRFLGEHLVE